MLTIDDSPSQPMPQSKTAIPSKRTESPLLFQDNDDSDSDSQLPMGLAVGGHPAGEHEEKEEVTGEKMEEEKKEDKEDKGDIEEPILSSEQSVRSSKDDESEIEDSQAEHDTEKQARQSEKEKERQEDRVEESGKEKEDKDPSQVSSTALFSEKDIVELPSSLLHGDSASKQSKQASIPPAASMHDASMMAYNQETISPSMLRDSSFPLGQGGPDSHVASVNKSASASNLLSSDVDPQPAESSVLTSLDAMSSRFRTTSPQSGTVDDDETGTQEPQHDTSQKKTREMQNSADDAAEEKQSHISETQDSVVSEGNDDTARSESGRHLPLAGVVFVLSGVIDKTIVPVQRAVELGARYVSVDAFWFFVFV